MSNLFDKLENGTPSEQVITLKSVYKTGKTTVQPTRDRFGWYKGIKRLSEEDKRKLTTYAEPDSKFTIQDGTEFDLSREDHRVMWEWIKHSSCIGESEADCQNTAGAEFYPYVPQVASEKNVSRRVLRHKAESYILEDNSSNYPSRALLLNVNMNGDHPSVIQEYLLEVADRTPEKIVDIYESHDVSVRLLLLKAQANRVITIDNGIYRYGHTALGMTEPSCVAWMLDKANKHVVESIERDVNPEYFAKEDSKEDVKIVVPELASKPPKSSK